MTGREVNTLGDLVPVLDRAKTLHPVPTAWRWTPYQGETLDAGMATLLAEETIEAVRFIYGGAAALLRAQSGRHQLHQPRHGG